MTETVGTGSNFNQQAKSGEDGGDIFQNQQQAGAGLGGSNFNQLAKTGHHGGHIVEDG